VLSTKWQASTTVMAARAVIYLYGCVWVCMEVLAAGEGNRTRNLLSVHVLFGRRKVALV